VTRIVASGKTPTCTFAGIATRFRIRIAATPYLDRDVDDCALIVGTDEEIAAHPRSYDTGQTDRTEDHIAGLITATRQANPSSARDRLRLAVPAIATL